MKYFLLFSFFIFSLLAAEISWSLGQTFGHSLQTIEDNDGTKLRQTPLPGRGAIFVELDSYDKPLWLKNDQVTMGLAAFAENPYQDYATNYNWMTNVPFYINYYLKFKKTALGFGLNFNILTLRHKNSTATLAQQLGYNLLFRYNINSSIFFESGLMQTLAAGSWQEETVSYYAGTNYIFRLGYYFEKNNLN